MPQTCCSCKPVLVGPHLIKPCAVSALQQVSPKGAEPLFIVRMQNMEDGTMFATESELAELLKVFGLAGVKIPRPNKREERG